MLYHERVYWPESVTQALAQMPTTIRLRYTRHARQAAISDRYLPNIVLPDIIRTAAWHPVEAELSQTGRLVKVLLQQPYRYHDDYKLSIVVHPEDGTVRTVWLNRRTDHHRTLDVRRYARGG